jgi:pilus assembly protein CpaE
LTAGREPALAAIIICPDVELARQLQQAVAALPHVRIVSQLAEYPGASELVSQVRQLHPEAILLDVGSDRQKALQILGQVADQLPHLSTVGLHRSNDPETILQCLRSGASEFLCSPFAPQDVAQAVERMTRRKGLETRPSPPARGRVLAFAPAKGGSGCTTLACTAAFQIKQAGKGSVLLADFSMTAGVVAFFMRMSHPYSVLDALKHSSRLDASLWGSLVLSRNGVDVLAAPERPEPSMIEPYPVQEVLQYVRSNYDYAVVDLGSVCESISMATLTVADEIFLVCSSEMPSLFLMRRTLPLLEEMGHRREQLHVLVNRVSRRGELTRADMEKIFRASVHATFPADPEAVNRALREGVSVAEGSELGKSVKHFVTGLLGKEASKEQRGAFGLEALKELLG